jgi:chromosome partitioning protein
MDSIDRIIGAHDRPQLMGVLPTMVRSGTRLHSELMRQMADQDIVPVYETFIRHNAAIADSTAMKKPIFEYAPRSSGAADYRSFTSEVERQLHG